MWRNTPGQFFTLFAWNTSTGYGVSGEASNITATISKDDGIAVATATTNPVALAGFKAGYYVLQASQAETNAIKISVQPVCSTAGVNVICVPGVIYPRIPYDPSLIFDTDVIADAVILSPTTEVAFDVANIAKFQAGDEVVVQNAAEVMRVTAVTPTIGTAGTITVIRSYGGSPAHSLATGETLLIFRAGTASGAVNSSLVDLTDAVNVLAANPDYTDADRTRDTETHDVVVANLDANISGLYTLLNNATYGLSALNDDLDTILANLTTSGNFVT